MHHFVTEMCIFLLQNGASCDVRLLHCGKFPRLAEVIHFLFLSSENTSTFLMNKHKFVLDMDKKISLCFSCFSSPTRISSSEQTSQKRRQLQQQERALHHSLQTICEPQMLPGFQGHTWSLHSRHQATSSCYTLGWIIRKQISYKLPARCLWLSRELAFQQNVVADFTTPIIVAEIIPREWIIVAWYISLSSLVQVMACRLFGDKPFPESTRTYCQFG